MTFCTSSIISKENFLYRWLQGTTLKIHYYHTKLIITKNVLESILTIPEKCGDPSVSMWKFIVLH